MWSWMNVWRADTTRGMRMERGAGVWRRELKICFKLVEQSTNR